nr:glycosyltransferase [Arsenicicoccus piscis]
MPGPQGFQGTTGAPGPQGVAGSAGPQGATGSQGSPGAQGSQGTQGGARAQGAQRSQGTQGATGAQGSTGTQGPQGYQGFKGDTGSQGSQGTTGAQGAQGNTGAQGSQGNQGSQGSTGAQGVQGDTGAQGSQGDPGLTVPKVSVFTPSHKTRYLDECFASLQRQTWEDWEWVIVLNGNARWRPEKPDGRVRLVVADELTGAGAAKRRVCEESTGDILVELDHDDLLTPDALAAVVEAFDANPGAALVYSHAAQVLEDGSRDDSRFAADAGWEYRDVDVDGRSLIHAVSLAPTPHNVSYIWFAPNHVRAFPRWAYDRAGGYDASLTVLDDQDLMCRLYALGEFVPVDRCLYLQRMHAINTRRDGETNAYIQQQTILLYDRYIEANAPAWSRRQGLLALDLGAAHNRPAGYLGVDQYPGPDVDIVATLPSPPDLPDGTVGVIRAHDFLEHVVDKVALINELYRVLAPGGMLLTLTPSTDGRGAFQDPTHVAYYKENSFWYYTEQQLSPAEWCTSWWPCRS